MTKDKIATACKLYVKLMRGIRGYRIRSSGENHRLSLILVSYLDSMTPKQQAQYYEEAQSIRLVMPVKVRVKTRSGRARSTSPSSNHGPTITSVRVRAQK
jgi:hypothetical protein